MAYTVSVVLIQALAGGRVAPPVLKRGKDDAGPVAVAAASPVVSSVRSAASELLPAMRLGDDLLVTGTGFDGAGSMTAVFQNIKADGVRELAPTPGGSPTRLALHVPSTADDPNAADDWAIGTYTVSLRVARPGLPEWTTNAVPIALAPRITVAPLAAAPGDVDLTVTSSPRLRPEQHVRAFLIFGSRSLAPKSVTTPADPTQPTTLAFTVPDTVAGAHVVRLRVDGIDSLPITIAGSPAKLEFDPQQKVTVG